MIQAPKIYLVVAIYSAGGLAPAFGLGTMTYPILSILSMSCAFSASQNAWLALYYLIKTESVNETADFLSREVAEHTGCSLQGEVRGHFFLLSVKLRK
jgi:hypothetical protein